MEGLGSHSYVMHFILIHCSYVKLNKLDPLINIDTLELSKNYFFLTLKFVVFYGQLGKCSSQYLLALDCFMTLIERNMVSFKGSRNQQSKDGVPHRLSC